MEKSDAEKLAVPHLVLASKDEPADAVAQYKDVITASGKGGHVETYETMWHGWMGARANFEKEDSRNEYARGYVLGLIPLVNCSVLSTLTGLGDQICAGS